MAKEDRSMACGENKENIECHARTRAVRSLLCLALVVAVAVFINFWKLPQIGLTHWDEYYWTGSALRMIGKGGFFNLWEPPGFPASVAVLMATFGVQDFVAVGASALWGALTVAIVCWFAMRLYGWKVGMTAGLILATTELFVAYSRMAMTDVMLSFFLTLLALQTYYAFESMCLRRFILVGIFAALSLGVKYNGLVGLATFYACAIVSLLLAVKKHAWVDSPEMPFVEGLKRFLAGLLAATCVPTLAYVVFMTILGAALHARASISRSLSVESICKVAGAALSDPLASFWRGVTYFWNNVVYVAHPEMRLGSTSVFRGFPYSFLEGVSGYVPVFQLWVSPLTLVFLFAGILAALHMKNKQSRFLLVWLSTTFLFCSSVRVSYSRMMIPVLPPLAIVSSLGVWSLARVIHLKHIFQWRVSREFVLGSALTALVVVAGFSASIGTIENVHDGYRKAGNFLKQRFSNGESILVLTQPVTLFYLRELANVSYDSSHLGHTQVVVTDFYSHIRVDVPPLQQYLTREGYIALAHFRSDVPLIVLGDSLPYDRLMSSTDDPQLREIIIYARNQTLAVVPK